MDEIKDLEPVEEAVKLFMKNRVEVYKKNRVELMEMKKAMDLGKKNRCTCPYSEN